MTKRDLPDAAYNCAIWRVVDRDSFFEQLVRRIQKRHFLDQLGPRITPEQRVPTRKSFFDSKLCGVINTRSVVALRADVPKFRERAQQLLSLNRVGIQSCARSQSAKWICYVSSQKIDRRLIAHTAGGKVSRRHCVWSIVDDA